MKKVFRAILSWLTNRTLITVLVVCMIFVLLINTLYRLQIVGHDEAYKKVYEDSVITASIKGVRGNIYDCHGVPLALNTATKSLYYRVDSDNTDLNGSIYSLLQIMQQNQEELNLQTVFPISYDEYSGYYYIDRYSNPTSTAFLNFLAEIYGTRRDELTEEQKQTTAEEAFRQMREVTFGIDASIPEELLMDMMKVRFAIFEARWTPEKPILIAENISDSTQVTVLEQQDQYNGFYVQNEYSRTYPMGEAFSHILGYVGRINESQYEKYAEQGYEEDDIIGKSGIESAFEADLRGTNGSRETVYSGATGKLISEKIVVASTKGNDVFLTIDSDFQQECYDLLYEQIKTLLINKINGFSSMDTFTYSELDVISALVNNGYFSIDLILSSEDPLAVRFSNLFNQQIEAKLMDLQDLLLHSSRSTAGYSKLEFAYFDSFIQYLLNQGYLTTEYRDDVDFYYAYTTGQLSALEFLKYCYNNNCFKLSEFGLNAFTESDEGLDVIVDTVLDGLRHESNYEKTVFSSLLEEELYDIDDFIELCYHLGFLDNSDGTKEEYEDGDISLLDLIHIKIKNDEITPADINLDPCSGSMIVSDIRTGEIRALVSYPSYDNNLFMKSPSYYTKVVADKSSPLLFRALQEARAPGSTFKMCTSAAGLELGYLNIDYTVYDDYAYPNVHSAGKPTCWSEYSHGYVNVVGALRDSCNYFFYDVGYRLCDPDPETGEFKDDVGLEKLAYYTRTMGLSTETGIELPEAIPQASDTDAVRSAIGQGSNNYTVANINRYTNTIANGGSVYDLFLVKRIQSADGTIVQQKDPEPVSVADVTEKNLNIIKDGMRLVNTVSCEEDLKDLEELGITSAGKTGTAEESKQHAEHSWYTGYTDFENPDVSVTICIPYGDGSGNAVPVFDEVVKAYYEVDENP